MVDVGLKILLRGGVLEACCEELLNEEKVDVLDGRGATGARLAVEGDL